MASEPESVVSEYFSRMRAADESVVELCHDDATLVGLGTTRAGKDAIGEFYRGVIDLDSITQWLQPGDNMIVGATFAISIVATSTSVSPPLSVTRS